MKAQKTLPPDYFPSGKFNLKNTKQVILMNLIGFILLIGSIWLFGWLAIRMRGNESVSFSFEFSSVPSMIISIGEFLAVIFLVLILHEAIHAIFFWFFSGEKPVIGFKGFYAYAAMPGWYFPRNQYILIGIAPLVAITLIGILFLAILPVTTLHLVLVGLVLNISGAVGDLFVVLWLLTKPVTTLALDQIETIEFFVPQN